MKIYGKNIEELSTKELEHRLSFLKRNESVYRELKFTDLEYKRSEERYAIETELFCRGARA